MVNRSLCKWCNKLNIQLFSFLFIHLQFCNLILFILYLHLLFFLPRNATVMRPLRVQIDGRMMVFNFILANDDEEANGRAKKFNFQTDFPCNILQYSF